MPRPDDESGIDANRPQLAPFELPPALADFLSGQEYAAVTEATDQGTAYVMKVHTADIPGLRGNIAIGLRHELHQHPSAPVIRTVITVFDRPQAPLKLETFINVHDEAQWAKFAGLSEQEEMLLLFYDETLDHRLTKRVRNQAAEQMRNILNWADKVASSIPEGEYDFDRAKATVQASTSL